MLLLMQARRGHQVVALHSVANVLETQPRSMQAACVGDDLKLGAGTADEVHTCHARDAQQARLERVAR